MPEWRFRAFVGRQKRAKSKFGGAERVGGNWVAVQRFAKKSIRPKMTMGINASIM